MEEQKQAHIHQAVTGQIDVRTRQPSPAYKDSGVEWLGEVPEHWEVAALSTLVHKYTNVFLGGGFQFVHELVQVVTSKFPLKRLSNGGVMLLKAQKPFFEGLQGKEVVRGKNFALDNGEIDLDLVQPTRMDGSVDGDDSRIFALKPADAAGSPVSRSIVQNPEDSSGFFIGSLGHDLIDQAAKRSNPIFSFTATEELGPMHIQCELPSEGV